MAELPETAAASDSGAITSPSWTPRGNEQREKSAMRIQFGQGDDVKAASTIAEWIDSDMVDEVVAGVLEKVSM